MQQLPGALAQFVGDLHEIYQYRVDTARAAFSVYSTKAARFPTLSRATTGVIVQSAGGVNVHVHVCNTRFWRLAHVLLLLVSAAGLGLALVLPGFFLVPGISGLVLTLSLALMWIEAARFVGVLEEVLP